MSPDELEPAVASVPAGAWAVGVSGGADSVALLSLLRPRAAAGGDLSLRVVHLDHQTRGAASAADADFVRELCLRWGLPCTVARRCEVEARLLRRSASAAASPANGTTGLSTGGAAGGAARAAGQRAAPSLPSNPSARYRAARLALFREVAAAHRLDGVLLAHHADDQAETVLHRLLRGSGYAGFAGMEGQATVRGLRILRPLLGCPAVALREHLRAAGQAWRDDESNASDDYLRNRLRRLLGRFPQLTTPLLELSAACRAARDWARGAAPVLAESFQPGGLREVPPVLARASAARWLAERGARAGELSPPVIDRLLAMAADAATPPRQHFPGGVLVRRRNDVIFAEPDP